ncbi:peptidylprolyl isomerase [Clostridium drakei]|uniref:Peptidylprolyl isomerase n=1 Tax=Clostridium drakei TaxID=332101 RepID=A0A2U8DXV4_9CLOT|nr:peptidylprolyl isomerase [Clostridium drakei]AWI07536.1 peptidylprolyl isomerase [Clostridium drakei]
MDNKVLAVVNGKEITQVDLDSTIKRFPNERQGYLQTEAGKKQLLEEIISFELIYNYAKDNNMENDSDYIAQLEMAKKEILTQTAIAKVMQQVSVEDKEVEDYYNANKENFKDPETVSAKHILVESEEKAKEVAEEINGGMDFEDAAQKYSSCPSKEQGGNLGKFGRGQMVPEFEEAAFALEIGTLSVPVKTQFGYHLIKVEDKSKGAIKSFEEVKNSIKSRLLQERQSFKYTQLNKELREKYDVEINN